MQRVSVTTLEKYRRYMAEASSFDTEEALIESLKGLFKGNDKTKFGGAYHKIIEGNYFWSFDKVHADEFVFTADQAQPAIEYRAAHRSMVHEMDIKKTYQTSFFPIQVCGRVDGIEGAHIRDGKTKFRSVKFQEYIDSCQWKFYLDSLGVNTFWYDLFEVQGFKELPAKPPFIMEEGVKVISHEPLKCERYPGMEEEISSLLNSFLEYIHNRGFISLLKPALPETELSF